MPPSKSRETLAALRKNGRGCGRCGRARGAGDGVELCREAELYRSSHAPKKRIGLFEGAGEVLNAEGVGVAGGFEGGSFVGAVGERDVTLALADVGAQVFEDLGQVGVGAGDGWSGERAGEVAVLAVRRAALRQVELPVGRGRYGLQLTLTRGRDDDGEGGLGVGVALAGSVGVEAGEAVAGDG